VEKLKTAKNRHRKSLITNRGLLCSEPLFQFVHSFSAMAGVAETA
jgi:hypothetical protein